MCSASWLDWATQKYKYKCNIAVMMTVAVFIPSLVRNSLLLKYINLAIKQSTSTCLDLFLLLTYHESSTYSILLYMLKWILSINFFFSYRIQIARRNINNLWYADDTTLKAESEEELKSLLMRVKEESEKVGLKFSIQNI